MWYREYENRVLSMDSSPSRPEDILLKKDNEWVGVHTLAHSECLGRCRIYYLVPLMIICCLLLFASRESKPHRSYSVALQRTAARLFPFTT